jgi:hypothetical protein
MASPSHLKCLSVYCSVVSTIAASTVFVKRYNGTTDGLGYLVLCVDCPCKSPPSADGSVRTVKPQVYMYFESTKSRSHKNQK